MKMSRKIISILLVLTLCFSLCPVSAFAEEYTSEAALTEDSGGDADGAGLPEEETDGAETEATDGTDAPADEPERGFALVITAQPTDAAVTDGRADFCVSAQAVGEDPDAEMPAVCYQWQQLDEAALSEGREEPREAAWTDMEDAAAPVLTVSGITGENYTEVFSSLRYRCFISCGDSFAVSDEVRILEPYEEKDTPDIFSLFAEAERETAKIINPLYDGIVTEADIPDVPLTDTDIAISLSGTNTFLAANNTREDDVIYSDLETAGGVVRSAIINRETSTVIFYCSDTEIDSLVLAEMIYSVAARHTGVPTEGDYYRFSYGGYGLSYNTIPITIEDDPNFYYELRYFPAYYTTAEQEQEMNTVVQAILGQLDLSGKTDLQKIGLIYDYLCDNVTYDYDNLENYTYTLKYTAYAALVNHTAVCQGYAAAFYRLCLEAGVDARAVSSDTMCHAWNIVKVGNCYYEADATWDTDYRQYGQPYAFFLRGSYFWLTEHTLDDGYSTLGDQFEDPAFAAAYPIPSWDAGSAAAGFCGAETNPGGAESMSWTLDEDGLLIITGSGDMADYDAQSPAPWEEYASQIRAVLLDGRVTGIGENAFAACTGLAELYFAGSDYELLSIDIRSGNDILFDTWICCSNAEFRVAYSEESLAAELLDETLHEIRVLGDITVNDDITVREGVNLTLVQGARLTLNGNVTLNGALYIDGGAAVDAVNADAFIMGMTGCIRISGEGSFTVNSGIYENAEEYSKIEVNINGGFYQGVYGLSGNEYIYIYDLYSADDLTAAVETAQQHEDEDFVLAARCDMELTGICPDNVTLAVGRNWGDDTVTNVTVPAGGVLDVRALSMWDYDNSLTVNGTLIVRDYADISCCSLMTVAYGGTAELTHSWLYVGEGSRIVNNGTVNLMDRGSIGLDGEWEGSDPNYAAEPVSEEQLRAALADEEIYFISINSDITVAGDIVIPCDKLVSIRQPGVTVTVTGKGRITVDGALIVSGGSEIDAVRGGTLRIGQGGYILADGGIINVSGGSFLNENDMAGIFVEAAYDPALSGFDFAAAGADLVGIGPDQLSFNLNIYNETELAAAIAAAEENGGSSEFIFKLRYDAVLYGVMPDNVSVSIGCDYRGGGPVSSTVTVPAGETLSLNGDLDFCDSGCTLYINGTAGIDGYLSVSAPDSTVNIEAGGCLSLSGGMGAIDGTTVINNGTVTARSRDSVFIFGAWEGDEPIYANEPGSEEQLRAALADEEIYFISINSAINVEGDIVIPCDKLVSIRQPGVTLTVVGAGRLTVNGMLFLSNGAGVTAADGGTVVAGESGFIQCCGGIIDMTDGSYENNGHIAKIFIDADYDAAVSGYDIASTTAGISGIGYDQLLLNLYIRSDAELAAAVAAAEENACLFTFLIFYDALLSGVMPDNVRIDICSESDSGSTVTVPAGETLSVNDSICICNDGSIFNVDGSLVFRDGIMDMGGLECTLNIGTGGTVMLAESGIYVGAQAEVVNNGTVFAPCEDSIFIENGGTWTGNAPKVSFPITYELNHEGAVNAQSNPEEYILGMDVITLADPTLTGYTFNGWYLNEGLTQRASAPQISKKSPGAMTFYAKWTPNTYTVKFVSGGGSGSMPDAGAKYDVELALTKNRFVRTGYTFIGWNTQPDGSGMAYADSETVINLTAVNRGIVTLYALWMPNSYTVEFDPNGGEGVMTEQEFIYGTAQELVSNAFTRTGYNFTGWKKGSTAYSDGQKVNNLTAVQDGVVTLTAQWKAKTYTVTFDKNSDLAVGNMSPQVMTYDAAAALKANAFRNTGYAFIGWALEPGSDDIVYMNSEKVKNLVSEGGVTLYAVWKPLATAIGLYCDALAEGSLDKGSFTVDMKTAPALSMSSAVTPADASQLVKWKTSSAAIAAVDDNGNVTFLKPGTVTISAATTDGSNKTASVKLNIIYMDAVSRLTASSDTPKIGLQVGDTAVLSVFGTDKAAPMGSELFSYEITTKGGEEYLRNNNDGTFTALMANKSVSIKASLIGDPLKRSVTLTIKTIPVQTGTVYVEPADLTEDYVRGIDALGDVCPTEEAVSYAIFVDKAGVDRTFEINVTAGDSDGELMEGLTGSSFTWASNAAGVASAAVSKTGVVTLTVKANAVGACTVTATSKDIAKVPGSIAVYVMDYAPRLDVTSVTLDTAKVNEAVLNLVPSYGNSVNSVRLLEGTAPSESLYIDSYDSETGRLVIKANGFIPNKSVRATLSAECDNGMQEFSLTVNIKNNIPSITVKQSKFNLFYRDSTATVQTTVKGETVTGISVEAEHFTKLSGEGETAEIGFAEGITDYTKINTGIKLHIFLEGYENGIIKDVRLSTETRKPTVKLSATSGSINTNAGELSAAVQAALSDGMTLSDGCAVSLVNFADVSNAGNDITVSPVQMNGQYKGGTVKFNLQDENWTQPIVCSYAVRLVTANPAVKPVKATLTVNTNIPGASDRTAVTTGQENVPATEIADAVLTKEGTNAEADKIKVEYVNGEITAVVTDSTVKAGTYRYSFIPGYGDTALAKVTVSVKADTALPTAKLSKTSLSISGFFAGASAETVLTLNNNSFTAAGIDGYYPTGSNAAEARENVALTWDEDTGIITAVFTGAYQKAASYTFSIPVLLAEGEGLKAKSNVTLTVRLTDDRPKVTFTPATVKLNTELAGREFANAFVSSSVPEGYYMGWELTEPAGSKIIPESCFYDDGTMAAAFYLDENDLPKNGSYRYTVTPVLFTDYDEELDEYCGCVELKPVTLTVQVYTNKTVTAAMSMSGKLDAVQREQSALLTVTKFNNITADYITDMELVGEDAGKFELGECYFNSKLQLCAELKLKEDESYVTNASYKVQCRISVLALGDGEETETVDVLTNVLNVKVTQSTIKAAAAPAAQTFYQSQSRSRWVSYKVSLTSPVGVEIDSISIGDVSLFRRSLIDEAENINWTVNGDTATVSVRLKDTSWLVAGRSYTLPLEIRAKGAAENAAPVKLNLTLKVMK